MSSGPQIMDFLRHRLAAKTRHGVHSPFVYALVDECIYAATPGVSGKVLAHFESLKKDKTLLEGQDLGRDQKSSRTVSDYAKNSAIPDVQAALLHRLVSYLKPANVLELGTNLGKSLACMASASSEGSFVGVEGNEALAQHASESLRKLELSHARVVHTSFDEFLSSDDRKYDLVFLDGDHRYEPTMRYFDRLKTKLTPQGAIIFHDIYWSEGMKQAWDEIKKDRDVTVTLDLFFLGIAWMGKPQEKEDFKIKFPLQLVRLLF